MIASLDRMTDDILKQPWPVRQQDCDVLDIW